MATLHITAGNEKGRSFPLSGNELRVGRGTDQDVVLTDVSASRKHFSIVRDGTRWKIVDHGSGNGTLLNGVKVPSAHLKDGDVLEIGQTAFRFEDKAPRPTAAPAQPKPLPPQAAHGTPSSGAMMTPPPPAGGVGTGAKVVLYGMMFLLSAGSVGIILTRTVLAKPVVIQSQADLVFKQGLHFFAAGEYENAKGSFNDALKAAPDSAQVKRYLGLCDSEAANKEKYKAGEKLLNAHRYDEAKKQLENVEASSVYSDRAMGLLREAKAHEGQSPPASAPVAAATPTPAPVAEKVDKAAEKSTKVAKVETASKATKDDSKMKPVNVMKSNPTAPPVVVEEKAPAGGGAAADSKAAMALYKNRDFVGAAKTYRMEAMLVKDASKLLATAKQVEGVRDLLDRAGNEEKSTPDKAVKTYEEAIAADQKLSKGVLASYIKGKIGGMSLNTAKSAFAAGKYEQAFQLAMSAQKAGSPDAGAVLKQLDQKAGEILGKAQAQQKTNPAEAKNLARQVQKMVPSGSQNYIKAYQIVNSSGAPRRDEDE